MCRLIENHAVFQNNSRSPQVHPRYQLAILLYRLGNPGGVSHEDTSTLLGLGEGTILLYSNCVLALVSLWERFISWPTRWSVYHLQQPPNKSLKVECELRAFNWLPSLTPTHANSHPTPTPTNFEDPYFVRPVGEAVGDGLFGDHRVY